MDSFIEKLIDALDTEEEICAETVLADVEEWDSLGLVSFVAMAKSAYGKQVNANDVRNAETVQDLFDLVN